MLSCIKNYILEYKRIYFYSFIIFLISFIIGIIVNCQLIGNANSVDYCIRQAFFKCYFKYCIAYLALLILILFSLCHKYLILLSVIALGLLGYAMAHCVCYLIHFYSIFGFFDFLIFYLPLYLFGLFCLITSFVCFYDDFYIYNNYYGVKYYAKRMFLIYLIFIIVALIHFSIIGCIFTISVIVW